MRILGLARCNEVEWWWVEALFVLRRILKFHQNLPLILRNNEIFLTQGVFIDVMEIDLLFGYKHWLSTIPAVRKGAACYRIERYRGVPYFVEVGFVNVAPVESGVWL